MVKNYKIRSGTAEDITFLKEMLYEAVFWSTAAKRIAMEDLFRVPEIAKMLDNWTNRAGDFSLIATNVEGTPIGAAWYRFWTEENHSYGFVDASIPELGISVVRKYRGRGLGRELMSRLMDHAKSSGIKKLSLSVDPANYALQLYQKLGFKKVSESGTSWTMVKELA